MSEKDAKNPKKTSLIREWWVSHHPNPTGADDDDQPTRRKASPADFARLRRCAAPIEALLEPATADLIMRFGERGRRKAEILGVIAAALAHVREDTKGKRFARQLGERTDERTLLSTIRFNRLMRADDPKDFLTALRRAIAVAGGKADVAQLGEGLLRLLGFYGEAKREREIVAWTLDYHGTPPPGATDDDKNAETKTSEETA